jgi:hypothetical protein
MAHSRNGISAWLVTWEHAAGHVKPQEKVAAVLSPRLSGQKVLEVVELLYANAEYDPSDRIAIAKSRKNNPYKAEFGWLEGMRWEGHIVCGHNPMLEARRVRNLRAVPNATGQERFDWDERPLPVIPVLAGGLRKGPED